MPEVLKNLLENFGLKYIEGKLRAEIKQTITHVKRWCLNKIASDVTRSLCLLLLQHAP